jgi:fructose-bisphosphate aldolase class II
MRTLREVLQEAERRKVGVGHFNVSDLTTLKAAFEAARELNVPVLVGVSEGERELAGSPACVRSSKRFSGKTYIFIP